MFTVVPHCQIIDELGLKDSSRKLVANYVISFVINLYLILHACVKIYDVTVTKIEEEEQNTHLVFLMNRNA